MTVVPATASSGPTRLLDPARYGLSSWLGLERGRPELAQGVARPQTQPGGAIRVLVADDDPVNRMMIGALLLAKGLHPQLVADGAQAVARVREQGFDLILMDLDMPVLDGLGATLAIRRLERASGWRAVPVVAYSSTELPQDVLAAGGLDGCLAKPCTDADLEDCLLRWCSGHRTAPSAGQDPTVEPDSHLDEGRGRSSGDLQAR